MHDQVGEVVVSIASKNSSSSFIVWREEEMLGRLGSGTACSVSGAAAGAVAGIDSGGGGDAIVSGGGPLLPDVLSALLLSQMTAKPMCSCTSEFKLEIHSERAQEDEKDA
jgi:hypothetical protein